MVCYDTSTSGTIWHYWATGTTAATCATSDSVWCEWNTTASTTTYATTASAPVVWQRWNTVQKAPELTAEQQAAAEANRLAHEQAAEKAKKEQEEATRRAEELLNRHLNEEQRKQYRKEKKFKVIGGDGAAFEIGSQWSGNVSELNGRGKPIRRFCAHPREQVPIPDLMLSQKLMLETDPEAFRKIANKTELAQT